MSGLLLTSPLKNPKLMRELARKYEDEIEVADERLRNLDKDLKQKYVAAKQSKGRRQGRGRLQEGA